MPNLTVKMRSDSFGIPTGDTGRSSGSWLTNLGTDYGGAVQTLDNFRVLVQDPGGANPPRIKFQTDPTDMATLAAAMLAGQINYIQPFVQHKTLQVTTADNGAMEYFVQMENPAGANLTTLMHDTFASIAAIVLATGAVQVAAPGGTPWTFANLTATQFSLSINSLGAPFGGGHPYINQWFVDQLALTVNYSSLNRFPMPLVGGAAGCVR